MSATGNGTNRWLDTAGTITIPTTSYSYAFWYNATHVPTTGAGTTNPMGLDAGGGATQDIGFTWDNPSASFYKSFVHIQAAGGACRVQIVGTPAASVWNHYCVTWDGTTLRVYLNGVLNNTATGTAPPGVAPTVTILAYANGASGFDAGSMAEMTVWNVTLTAAEAQSLGTGTLATTIQNSAIIFYDTLNTGGAGHIGPALTAHNTPTMNTTYFQSCDGGPGLGSNAPVTTIYNWAMTGGPGLGSAFVVGAHFGWTMSGGPGIGSDFFMPAHYNWVMSGGVKFGGNQMVARTIYTIGMAGPDTGGYGIGGNGFKSVHRTANHAIIIASGRENAYTTR